MQKNIKNNVEILKTCEKTLKNCIKMLEIEKNIKIYSLTDKSN